MAFPSDTPPLTPDWRTNAMLTALESWTAESVRISNFLIAQIQRNEINTSIRIHWADKNHSLRALPECLLGCRSLLRSPLAQNMENPTAEIAPVFGWWEGRCAIGDVPINVVLCPVRDEKGFFLITGENDKAIERFANHWERRVKALHTRFRRFSNFWKDDPEMEAEARKITWDDLVLPPATLADIRGSIEQFFLRQDVFTSLGFPWRRGVLLVGPPGTGKTMVCKAVASAYPEIPFLYVAEMPRPSHIQAVFAHARECAPCVLAFEDIDSLLHEGLRTVFLNELDGFQNNHGLLVIASSNHPEKIDEALLKRPSRFDRVYHIGLPAASERREYARRLLDRTPNLSPDLDRSVLLEEIVARTKGFTPAFLKEVFLSATLQMAQDGSGVLGEEFVAAIRHQSELLNEYLKKANTVGQLKETVGAPDNGIGFRPRDPARKYGD